MSLSEESQYQGGNDTVSVLLHLQNAILKMNAKGAGLAPTCTTLCAEVERILPDVICSVLTVDVAGLLHPLAGPNLPEAYSQALDGLSVGPLAGSCGTAAYLKTDITVVDIETDARWAQFKDLALSHGLRACWSSPICDADSRAIATFAFYYRSARGPTAFEREVVANCVNLTQIAIERHERVLEHQRRAFTDALTGCPNRAAYHAALSKLEGAAVGSWALFVLDLDNLKVVNDTFAHHAGDELLQIASDRISAAVSPGRTFRVGGDEFAVILQATDALRDLEMIADEALSALSVAADCGGHSIVPRATIGGATFSSDDAGVGSVRQNADFALYHAKETGRGGFVRYWAGLRSNMTRRMGAIRGLSAALREDRIQTDQRQPEVFLCMPEPGRERPRFETNPLGVGGTRCDHIGNGRRIGLHLSAPNLSTFLVDYADGGILLRNVEANKLRHGYAPPLVRRRPSSTCQIIDGNGRTAIIAGALFGHRFTVAVDRDSMRRLTVDWRRNRDPALNEATTCDVLKMWVMPGSRSAPIGTRLPH